MILCPDGAVPGVSVSGGSPDTQNTDIIRPAPPNILIWRPPHRRQFLRAAGGERGDALDR
ncbi:hypothetical protein [Propionispora sp. 2/2-37]|uniref:hypothetical protein n=1 Tax=Propionispora sp. 2/2-37 TaxID=1677858 RepID=UPI001F3615CC|nr:hypothetical protein [Propionispora sp. 2/2-37]